MGFHSFIEAAKVLQNNANNQRIINAEFFSRILSINKVLPDYFDTEWVMYNIVLVTVLLYVSHLVSLAYRCNRAHYRQLNRIYIEKKWLDSRIELLNRKRAAMSLITEQLKQEICREMFAFNIIEKCEKQSLEKLESKKLEDINYASQCLSKLEYNNASLQSKILSVKASISSECSDYPSSSNATSTSLRNVSYIPIDSVSNSQINTTCCNLDSLVSLNDIFLGDSIDNMTSTPNRYITDGNNLLNYPDLVNINHESMSENLNIDMNNGSDFDNNNSEEEEEEELSEEDFSLSSTSMLAVSFDTNITGMLFHLTQMQLVYSFLTLDFCFTHLFDFRTNLSILLY